MGSSLTSAVKHHDGQVGEVALEGRLDITSATEVKRLFSETVNAGASRLIVNLEEISFIDSSGLSALVSGLRACRQAGGDLRIAAPGEQPRAVLALTSLDQVFHLYPTVGEALHGFRV